MSKIEAKTEPDWTGTATSSSSTSACSGSTSSALRPLGSVLPSTNTQACRVRSIVNRRATTAPRQYHSDPRSYSSMGRGVKRPPPYRVSLPVPTDANNVVTDFYTLHEGSDRYQEREAAAKRRRARFFHRQATETLSAEEEAAVIQMQALGTKHDQWTAEIQQNFNMLHGKCIFDLHIHVFNCYRGLEFEFPIPPHHEVMEDRRCGGRLMQEAKRGAALFLQMDDLSTRYPRACSKVCALQHSHLP